MRIPSITNYRYFVYLLCGLETKYTDGKKAI